MVLFAGNTACVMPERFVCTRIGEWVNVSSGTGSTSSAGQRAVNGCSIEMCYTAQFKSHGQLAMSHHYDA